VLSSADVQTLRVLRRGPQETAVLLATAAEGRRISRGMRMDDITVIVVDINAHRQRHEGGLYDFPASCCCLS
jgi:hypothetical protein